MTFSWLRASLWYEASSFMRRMTDEVLMERDDGGGIFDNYLFLLAGSWRSKGCGLGNRVTEAIITCSSHGTVRALLFES